MDEPSQKKRNFDAIITAINIAALGAGIAVAVAAANKSKAPSAETGRIEKTISELNTKFDRISQQLKSVQPEINTTAKETEKKPEGAPEPNKKAQDLIYVRKSSEFSFYN
jgi:septal ring factor EnvC (AmiA/AmiB activator)